MSILSTHGGDVLAVSDDHVGIVPNLREKLYHSHPALSSTGARQLLDSPARFQYERDNPRADTKAFDVGTAAHSKVLGVGAGIAVYPDGEGDHVWVDPDTMDENGQGGVEYANVLGSNGAANTAIAKKFAQATRAAGLIPVKRDESDAVDRMAEGVLKSKKARLLLEQEGIAEASVFATDPDTGVNVRCRFDFLGRGPRRRVAVDIKTIGRRATPTSFAKAVAEHEYEVQEAHYGDTLRFAGEEYDAFCFIVVEKDAPHLARVFALSERFRDMGRTKAAHARRLFAQYSESGEWPGYPDTIGLIEPPMYAVYDYQDRFENGFAA
ncbi:PD-(D/E)XK nuclease-like domain-containing protein [Microbacterium arborescens]|uniref:PD-(D/E)XK nuclease-like domain-containing protein n=1 Tax=Microbacterium arborescens TaxID=33883 RepID=UPI0013B43107|nr:PD-(D/E)XK nuclease-like domain-containing protein [Microbacterium arborescens]